MMYLDLLEEGDEEGGQDGDGAGEQDPLPFGPLQVQETLTTHKTNHPNLSAHFLGFNQRPYREIQRCPRSSVCCRQLAKLRIVRFICLV